MCSSGEVRSQWSPEGGGSKKASLAGAGIRTGVSTSVKPRASKNCRTRRRTSARRTNASHATTPLSLDTSGVIYTLNKKATTKNASFPVVAIQQTHYVRLLAHPAETLDCRAEVLGKDTRSLAVNRRLHALGHEGLQEELPEGVQVVLGLQNEGKHLCARGIALRNGLTNHIARSDNLLDALFEGALVDQRNVAIGLAEAADALIKLL